MFEISLSSKESNDFLVFYLLCILFFRPRLAEPDNGESSSEREKLLLEEIEMTKVKNMLFLYS